MTDNDPDTMQPPGPMLGGGAHSPPPSSPHPFPFDIFDI